MAHALRVKRAERRSGRPSRELSLVLPGAVGGCGTERGAEFLLAAMCVVGRLEGGVAEGGAATG